MVIEVIKGDILAQPDLDCIVNPANSHLRHGGGLARAIDVAAYGGNPGPFVNNVTGRFAKCRPNGGGDVGRVGRWQKDNESAPLIATGDAYTTSAGLLPYKRVIHAVGPVYGGGNFYESGLLISAYTRALEEAELSGCTRVGLPAISCGIFGYPVEKAAPLALAAVFGYSFTTEKLRLARFVMFSDEHYEAFTKSMSDITE
jgi:O-acetyl-ADP-ribose deacetylase (regulator of RNase III)